MGSRVREIAFAWPPVATPADYSTYITTEKSGSLAVSSSAGQSQYQNQQQNQHQKYNNQPQQYQQQHIAGPPLYQFTPCVPTTIASAKPSAGRIQAASFAGMTCDLTNDDDDVTGGDGILSIASSTGSTTGPIVSPLHPAPQQISHHYAPQQATKVSQSTSLMSPLSGGGFIFNYPPLYSETPLSPFSRPHPVSASFAAIQQIPVNASMPSTPISPTSPVSDSFSVPGSPLSCPVSPQFTNGIAPVVGRKEKLEKYKQKRTKRNHSRPVDQARRERAQLRTRDELGHFLACPKKPEKHQFEMEDVRNKLEVWMKESQALKDKLNQVESRLEEQQKINTQLLHENRILWSTVAPSDVFNTTRPGSSYSDAFKEKVDLTNIELNWTDSPYLGSMKLDDIEHWPLDVDSTLDFSSS